jgi:hypothetical protein
VVLHINPSSIEIHACSNPSPIFPNIEKKIVRKKRKKIVHFKMVQCTAASASAKEKKENCSF